MGWNAPLNETTHGANERVRMRLVGGARQKLAGLSWKEPPAIWYPSVPLQLYTSVVVLKPRASLSVRVGRSPDALHCRYIHTAPPMQQRSGSVTSAMCRHASLDNHPMSCRRPCHAQGRIGAEEGVGGLQGGGGV